MTLYDQSIFLCQVLLDEYTSTQDRWRAFGYKKAIASISKHHKPLESFDVRDSSSVFLYFPMVHKIHYHGRES